jgi:hypothetical protein
MTLMNALREIHGLPVIAFSDPNLVDTLSFNDMNNFEGLVFNVPDREPSNQEIRSIIYKSVVAHSFVDNLRNPNIYKRKWTTAQMESIFFTNKNITKYGMDEDEITLGRHNLLSTAPDDVGNQLALKYLCSIYPDIISANQKTLDIFLKSLKDESSIEKNKISDCIQEIKVNYLKYLSIIIQSNFDDALASSALVETHHKLTELSDLIIAWRSQPTSSYSRKPTIFFNNATGSYTHAVKKGETPLIYCPRR